MKSIKFSACILLFLLFKLNAFSQTDTLSNSVIDSNSVAKEKKVIITGYLKDLNTISIPTFNGNWGFDNFIHNRINLKWYAHKTTVVKIEARTRFFFGESVKNNPQFPEIVNTSLDYFKLGGEVAKSKSYLLNSFIDRANIDWNYKKWQIILGKQRINWSKSYVWNPNDIFNAYSFFDFDYEERRGTDAALVKYNINNISSFEIASNIDSTFDKTTMAAKYNINKYQYDFQFLGGKYKTDIVAGAGWAGQIKGAGFKGEASYFQPYLADTISGTFIAAASFDYAFANTLNLRLEGIYNSNPQKPKSALFFLQPVTASQLTFNHYSVFASVGYDINPLIKASVNGIWYIDDESFFINPTLNFNINSNTELLIASQLFGGKTNSTFGNIGNYVFTRLKWSF